MRRPLAVTASAATVVALSLGTAFAFQPSTPHHHAPALSVERPLHGSRGDLAGVGTAVNTIRWYAAARSHNATAWYAAASARLAAERADAVRRTSRARSGDPGGSGGTITGTCGAMAPPGFPAYIVDRESGGDPNAVNSSSGALGCAQILPSHFSRGSCQGMSYAQCWAVLWANGEGASNWSTG